MHYKSAVLDPEMLLIMLKLLYGCVGEDHCVSPPEIFMSCSGEHGVSISIV